MIHALIRSPIFRPFHTHGIGVGTPMRRFQFLPSAKDDLAKQAGRHSSSFGLLSLIDINSQFHYQQPIPGRFRTVAMPGASGGVEVRAMPPSALLLR